MTRASNPWIGLLAGAAIMGGLLSGCADDHERLAGLGARCARDRDCGGRTPICAYTGYCVACESEADCNRDVPFCNAEGFCAQCLSNNDCGGEDAFCDARLDECVQCTRNSDCRVTEACAPEGECVPRCETNADCDEDEVCSGKACVECGSDTHCGGDEPLCNVQKRECIECRSDNDCSTAEPVCVEGECQDCVQNLQCDLTQLCNEDLECVGD